MLKAYKTPSTRRALRVTLVSDYLDEETLKKYCSYFDCVSITNDLYISIYLPTHYPIINIDEYFIYTDLMNIDITRMSVEREESFAVLLEILETKYGIEYVDSER
mgnify:CR=1 FL=1